MWLLLDDVQMMLAIDELLSRPYSNSILALSHSHFGYPWDAATPPHFGVFQPETEPNVNQISLSLIGMLFSNRIKSILLRFFVLLFWLAFKEYCPIPENNEKKKTYLAWYLSNSFTSVCILAPQECLWNGFWQWEFKWLFLLVEIWKLLLTTGSKRPRTKSVMIHFYCFVIRTEIGALAIGTIWNGGVAHVRWHNLKTTISLSDSDHLNIRGKNSTTETD